MCGIAGFYHYISKRPASTQQMVSILKSIKYRGPDQTGYLVKDTLGIGSNRLAIIDLTAGDQPIYNEDKTVVVVFTGEIYNYPELKRELESTGHRFATRADTEIIVHLWEDGGEAAIAKLNGMFAFALYDFRKNTFILARDRTAQKPLYYSLTNDGIIFSSEIKSLLPYVHDPRIDSTSVRTYLSMGYTLEPNTIIKQIKAVLPAGVLSINENKLHIHKYWEPAPGSKTINNYTDWAQRFAVTFDASVKRHLLSDVPITLFLSGGVDSSLLSLHLKKIGVIHKVFTASFADEPGHDEFPYARNLGVHSGFDVERINLTRKVLAANVENLLRQASMPMGDNSALPLYCLAQAVSREFKVVLGGDGGDELFGGYPTYTMDVLNRKMNAFIPGGLIKAAHNLARICADNGSYLSWPFVLQQMRLGWGRAPGVAHYQWKNYLPDNLAAQLLSREFKHQADMPEYGEHVLQSIYADNPFKTEINKLCWLDFVTFLQSCVIPKVERNSMLWSLEARMPYLDNEMLDLAFVTSDNLKLKNNYITKYCLRRVIAAEPPKKLTLNPRKQGFNPPLHLMFRNELSEWKRHWLGKICDSTLFNSNAEACLLDWEKNGWDLHRLYWNIFTLLDWCERNRIPI